MSKILFISFKAHYKIHIYIFIFINFFLIFYLEYLKLLKKIGIYKVFQSQFNILSLDKKKKEKRRKERYKLFNFKYYL